LKDAFAARLIEPEDRKL